MNLLAQHMRGDKSEREWNKNYWFGLEKRI